ncbi:MAG TPA: hypothetical protein VK815_16210 [Candidatus Acidoferrales bacterium]|nr:hypothetical protein [Candidatus Acidoferrales bacterium]
MIKAFILSFFICLTAAAADDMADAKVAFTNLVTYQKTDDLRALDLFAKHCLITYIINDGKSEKTVVVPADAFREGIKQGIAKKEGNKDEYEDVKFTKDGDKVTVTATVHYADSGKRAPFFASYARDDGDGVMRIEKLKITMITGEPAH